MTKEEFAEYERICKETWKKIADEGLDDKPKNLEVFYNHCPACEIASLPNGDKSHDDFLVQDCCLCPITLWREHASEMGTGWAVCQDHDNPDIALFGAWMNNENEDVAEAARKISELEWSWLPEYELVFSILKDYKED